MMTSIGLMFYYNNNDDIRDSLISLGKLTLCCHVITENNTSSVNYIYRTACQKVNR